MVCKPEQLFYTKPVLTTIYCYIQTYRSTVNIVLELLLVVF